MAPKRIANRLTAMDVNRKGPGKHLDGNGLYLQVGAGRSWIYEFPSPTRVYPDVNPKTGESHTRAGKPQVREMGLGPTSAVKLAQARKLAEDARAQVKAGIDPIDAREAAVAKARLEAARIITFKEAAESYIAAHRKPWRGKKQEPQWRASLETYAHPIIGKLPVADVDLRLVRKVLEPIWHTKAETARRVRARIEAILDRETGLGNRTGDNPANLALVTRTLGKQGAERGHFAALPYAEIATFMEALHAEDGVGAKALEFLILTAARTGEVIGAIWREFDLEARVWTVPAERMKARKEHRVPLSDRAVEILRKMHELRATDAADAFVFPGGRKGKPLSNMAMLATLARMERDDVTAHGFRSSFRDWAADQTNFPGIVAEAALAHTVPDKVEAAYRRGELMQKRKQLMDAWGRYCATKPAERGKVVAIGQGKK